MGDLQNNTTAFLLPPGCRFYPSEEQLLCYYLTNKNNANTDFDDEEKNNNRYGYDLIKELDLYEYEPYRLPERACYAYGYGGRKRHWFCYSKVRVMKESSVERKIRRAKNGYWKRRGRVRDVVVVSRSKTGKVILGTRTSFAFYLGDSMKTAVRTEWLMYEYSLVDHVKASFVLCRVFVKSCGGNSISEAGLSCGVEESVSAIPHIGVRHDGFLTPDIVETRMNDDNYVGRGNDISRCSKRLASQLDAHLMSGPVSVPSFQFPMGIPPNEQVSTSGLTGGGMFVEGMTAQELLSIVEEDFIELDDLLD